MSERKPVMDDDRRKVLDLLEFIAELCPMLRVCQIIGNAVPYEVAKARKNDIYYISDKEMAGYLQDLANNLLHLSAARWDEDEDEEGVE